MSNEEKFNAAVNVIRSLPKDGPYQPSHDMMLKFYGLFKQATEGPCSDPKPAFYDLVKGYKWRAWKNYGTMSKEDAMGAYVEELKKIVETMSYTDNVATFIDALGPIYEYVDIMGLKKADNNHNIQISNSVGGEDGNEEEDVAADISASMCNGTSFYYVSNGLNEKELDDDLFERKKKLNQNNIDINEESSLKMNGFVNISHENEIEMYSKNVKHSGSFKRLASDTESDEEYSEPAETPEFLLQEGSTPESCATPFHDRKNIPEELATDDTTRPKMAVHGGGDADDLDQGRKKLLTRDHRGRQVPSRHSYDKPDDADTSSGRGTGSGAEGGGRPPREWGAPPKRNTSEEVNAQLVLILQKIHQDLQGVLFKLDRLESQAFGRHPDPHCQLCQKGAAVVATTERNWWPFPELSPRSTLLLLTWPFILKGLLKCFIFLRSRRRNRK